MKMTTPESQNARLTVVAARPGMGRLGCMCEMANERSIQHKVLFFAFALRERMLANKYSLSQQNVMVVERYPLNFDELEQIIRNEVEGNGCKTVMIYYLNLLHNLDSDTVLLSLKALARELDIEIIAAVSVARVFPNGIIAAPTFNDIRMKGTEAIDEFIPLHNPEFYTPIYDG